MAISTALDYQLEEKSSSLCFYGKPFKNEASSSLELVESQQEHEIKLNYSIDNGLEEEQNLQQEKKSSGSFLSKIIDPRRRKVYFTVASVVLLLFISIVAISASVSNKKKESMRPSSIFDSIQEDDANDVNSRFTDGSRGEGSGAGNDYFQIQSNNDGNFPIDDVPIPPFSVLDPVEDLERYGYDRPTSSSPNARLDPLRDHRKGGAIPTNAWYQNMLRLDVDQEPTKNHRVYTVPYILDAAGIVPGIRAHATRLEATPSQVMLQIDEPYALTLGAMTEVKGEATVATVLDKGYSVHEATALGLTLHWGSYMKSTLVRGSPYVTMIYNMADPSAISSGILPTMHWQLDTSEMPIVDGTRTVDCQSEPVFTVERDIELAFLNSNQRWLVFFSRRVQLQCHNERGSPTILQVLKDDDDYEKPLLVVRGALIVSSYSTNDDHELFSKNYANQLRAHADIYPGQSTAVTHSFDEESDQTRISFNWDPQSMRIRKIYDVDQMISRTSGGDSSGRGSDEMMMFALPHHQEVLSGNNSVMSNCCTISLLGPVCLTKGNIWNMYEDLPTVDFQAPRHPDPKYVPVLAKALLEDIRYQIPQNFQIGAGDTYFSGKTIAKLARILLITEEMKDLCEDGSNNSEYDEACDGLELPNKDEIDEALEQLRDTVTVWVKTNSQAPFVYDNAWGGLISCGCLYDNGQCTNQIPDCPAFTDQGLNFGNGFYNDHHFHYGYHIYAAAAVAHFDSAWAIDHYEDVLLLVRDYANPSVEDTAFPTFRNKDWYRGHSWASGLTEPKFDNIMNQESSGEAIAAYESVALFGKVMTSIFQDIGDTEKASVTKMIHNIGLTLTATEVRSTQKYWQVRQNVEDSEKRFPAIYTASVVGILWETALFFTTWFGNAPYLIYGIQLLPLTPISESRDNMKWAEEIYEPLAASCNALCISEGWSVQVYAILATIGRVQEAVENTLNLPSSVYEHAGGNGHSKSNTLWYIASRPYSSSPSNEKKFQTMFEENPSIEIFDNENDDDDDDDDDDDRPLPINSTNYRRVTNNTTTTTTYNNDTNNSMHYDAKMYPMMIEKTMMEKQKKNYFRSRLFGRRKRKQQQPPQQTTGSILCPSTANNNDDAALMRKSDWHRLSRIVPTDSTDSSNSVLEKQQQQQQQQRVTYDDRNDVDTKEKIIVETVAESNETSTCYPSQSSSHQHEYKFDNDNKCDNNKVREGSIVSYKSVNDDSIVDTQLKYHQYDHNPHISNLSLLTSTEYSSSDDTTTVTEHIRDQSENKYDKIKTITTEKESPTILRIHKHEESHNHGHDNCHNNRTSVSVSKDNDKTKDVWEKISELNERQKCFVQRTSAIDILPKNHYASAGNLNGSKGKRNKRGSTLIINKFNEQKNLPQPNYNQYLSDIINDAKQDNDHLNHHNPMVNRNTTKSRVYTNADNNESDFHKNDIKNSPDIVAHTKRMIAKIDFEQNRRLQQERRDNTGMDEATAARFSTKELMPPAAIVTSPSGSASTRRQNNRSYSSSTLRGKPKYDNNDKGASKVTSCQHMTSSCSVATDDSLTDREALMGLEIHKHLNLVKDFVKLDGSNFPSFECGSTNRSGTTGRNIPPSSVVSESTPSGSRPSDSSTRLVRSSFLPSAMSCFFPRNSTDDLGTIDKKFADNNQIVIDSSIEETRSSNQIKNHGLEENNPITADSFWKVPGICDSIVSSLLINVTDDDPLWMHIDDNDKSIEDTISCSTGICDNIVSSLLINVADDDPLWMHFDDNHALTRRRNQITTGNKIPPKENQSTLPKSNIQKSSIREAANNNTMYEAERIFDAVSRYNKPRTSMLAETPKKINKIKSSIEGKTRYDVDNHTRTPELGTESQLQIHNNLKSSIQETATINTIYRHGQHRTPSFTASQFEKNKVQRPPPSRESATNHRIYERERAPPDIDRYDNFKKNTDRYDHFESKNSQIQLPEANHQRY